MFQNLRRENTGRQSIWWLHQPTFFPQAWKAGWKYKGVCTSQQSECYNARNTIQRDYDTSEI